MVLERFRWVIPRVYSSGGVTSKAGRTREFLYHGVYKEMVQVQCCGKHFKSMKETSLAWECSVVVIGCLVGTQLRERKFEVSYTKTEEKQLGSFVYQQQERVTAQIQGLCFRLR